MHDTGEHLACRQVLEQVLEDKRVVGRTLALRADGDGDIGTGHVMRCLALADAWQRAGGRVCLISATLPRPIRQRYEELGVRVDALGDRAAPERAAAGADMVVLDGQHFPDSDLDEFAATGVPLMVIDDHGWRPRYPCSLILNQNAYASVALYEGKTSAGLCLGPRWCLLRREFADPPPRVAAARVERIAILMGGADPAGRSGMVLDSAARAVRHLGDDVEIVLVVGAANPAAQSLDDRAAGLPGRVTVLHDVRNMAPIMASADLAISAAGSTIWELAALGTPMILGAQNRGELGTANVLAEQGAAIDLGPLDGLEPDRLTRTIVEIAANAEMRQRMSAAGQRLVDGAGAVRVVARMADLLGPADG